MRRCRIVIDLVPIRPGKGGTGSGIWTHALSIIRHMDAQDLVGLDIVLFTNPAQRPFFTDLRQVRQQVYPDLRGSGMLRLLWMHLLLPMLCLVQRVRVLHKVATETPAWSTARRVTTVHDFFNEFITEQGGGAGGYGAKYFAWAARLCFRKSRVVITVSEAVRQEALIRHPNTRARIVAIHNGVDAPERLPEMASPPEHERTVLCVAKFMPYKGQMEALEAFDRMLEDAPEWRGKVRLVLHGFNNDESYFRALQQRMGQGHLPGAVEVRGYGNAKTVQEIYQGADVFLFLTRYEGFGLPVVESQALGIPVVCSDIPVLREVGGEGAVYVDRSSAVAVAAALRRVLDDPGWREQLVTNGLRNAHSFPWSRTAQRTVQVYREVCG